MGRGAWRATVHGVAKSRTQLSKFKHAIYSVPVVLGTCRALEKYPAKHYLAPTRFKVI